MNNLGSLVPPLELCKKIPAGKFADSALVWGRQWFVYDGFPAKNSQYEPFLRDNTILCEVESISYYRKENPNATLLYECAPAPTAAEILECLTANWLDVPEIQYDGVLWKAFYTYHNSGNPMTPQPGTTATTAALRLWLDVEGVK